MLKDKAYAKINLSLNISKVREDGYHELEMVNLPLDFYDTVYLCESPDLEVISNVNLPENNTLIRAVEEARKEFGFRQNFRIVVQKEIPFESGLGGGSADAASVLRLLKKYFRWNAPEETMLKIAKRVGADVPFQYLNYPCYTTGIGEYCARIAMHGPYYVLLVKPNSGVSTPKAFKKFDEIGGDHPDLPALKRGLLDRDLKKIACAMGNSLERASFTLNLQVEPIKEEMKRMGLDCALMSGSGATVFALHTEKEPLEEAAKIFAKRFSFTKVVRILE